MPNTLQLSIIVPVYKTEALLGRCLNSIICTSLDSYEILVVADAPSKECEAIVQQYQQQQINIQLFEHRKNLGLFQARLTGIIHAKGKYIAHLDSDDYIENDIYKKAFLFAEATGSDITLFQAIKENEQGKRYNYDYNNLSSFQAKTGMFCLNKIFSFQTNAWIWHGNWNKLIRRSCYKKVLPYLPKNKYLNLHEDLLFSAFCYIFLHDTPSIGAIDEVGLIYTSNENSITRKNNYSASLNKARDTLYVLKTLKKLLKKFTYYKEHEQTFELVQEKLLATSYVEVPSRFSLSEYLTYIRLLYSRLSIGGIQALSPITPQKAKKILIQKVLSLQLEEVSIFGTTDLAKSLALEMKKKNIKINYFLATNPDSDTIDGIKVQVPTLKHKDENVVVASIGSHKQIAELFLNKFNMEVITI